MKNLADYQNEINKCSKCGLCQSVCPIFKETGNECSVSRGLFVMLSGVLNGNLKLTQNINKYLSMCLKCGKCKDFCPSEIDVCKILEVAKYEYVKNTLLGRFIFLLESKLVFGNLIKLFKKKYQIFNPQESDKLKLLYFRGCVGKIFNDTENLLKKIPNIEIIEKNFDCCGIPFLSSGNLERYEEVKNYNLSLIDSDCILTDCASCESTLKSYFEKECPKFINIGELVVEQNVNFEAAEHIKITFHKPCHLKNDDFIKPLFLNIENVEYIEMDDSCCGFAGEFALNNPKLSNLILKKKIDNILNTGADIVVTTCPSCILGIKKGLFGVKKAPKVMSLSEFLLTLKIID